MFVRFRRQTLKKGSVSLRAELVESYRDARKGDAPRNRFIAYLGSLKDSSNPVSVCKFWRGLETRLARLRLAPDVEELIREKVQAEIPYKTWSDLAAYLSKFSRRVVGQL